MRLAVGCERCGQLEVGSLSRLVGCNRCGKVDEFRSFMSSVVALSAYRKNGIHAIFDFNAHVVSFAAKTGRNVRAGFIFITLRV